MLTFMVMRILGNDDGDGWKRLPCLNIAIVVRKSVRGFSMFYDGMCSVDYVL